MLATINFCVLAPGFLGVAASLFDHVSGVEPALQVPATEFALRVFFVAGPLPGFLDFHLVVWELRGSLRVGSNGCGQGFSSSRAANTAEFDSKTYSTRMLFAAEQAFVVLRGPLCLGYSYANGFFGAACCAPTLPTAISATK